jgi:hypothetical protein
VSSRETQLRGLSQGPHINMPLFSEVSSDIELLVMYKILRGEEQDFHSILCFDLW